MLIVLLIGILLIVFGIGLHLYIKVRSTVHKATLQTESWVVDGGLVTSKKISPSVKL